MGVGFGVVIVVVDGTSVDVGGDNNRSRDMGDRRYSTATFVHRRSSGTITTAIELNILHHPMESSLCRKILSIVTFVS